MLNKSVFCVLIITLSASFSFAQTTTNSDDYHKFELFGGYSHNQVGTGVDDDSIREIFDSHEGHNGFEVSGVGNINRYVGIKGDFSAHFRDFETISGQIAELNLPGQRIKLNTSLYNFLGGVQIKDNAKEGSRFRPFAHALVGVAVSKANITFCPLPSANCFETDNTETGFGAAFGGGIDIKATRRLSIRAIQFDYNPTRLGGLTQNNFRFGVGLVFH